MLSFLHTAAIAVWQAFIGFDPVPESISVEGTLLFLAKLDVRIASVTALLFKKEFRGGRRKRTYTDLRGFHPHGQKTAHRSYWSVCTVLPPGRRRSRLKASPSKLAKASFYHSPFRIKISNTTFGLEFLFGNTSRPVQTSRS